MSGQNWAVKLRDLGGQSSLFDNEAAWGMYGSEIRREIV